MQAKFPLRICLVSALIVMMSLDAFAQIVPITACNAGQIKKYARKKAAVESAGAAHDIARNALSLEQEHQARLDADFEATKVVAISNGNSFPTSTREEYARVVEVWAQKATKAREKHKATALKSAQKILDKAAQKYEKAQASDRAYVLNCTL